MITLHNIYSREKTLFYFTVWNDSDRLGYERFLGYKVRHNLFIIPPPGQKGSVWYPEEELSQIDASLDKKVTDPSFDDDIALILNTYWGKLCSYLEGNKDLESAEELLEYYNWLVEWWSAMNTVFTVPDKENAPALFKEKVLNYRTESEKYTERMNKVFVEYWKKNFPELTDLASVLLPEEAAAIARNEISSDKIGELRQRLSGCFMHNRTIYLLNNLEAVLKNEGLELEKLASEEVTEIKGRPAQVGFVRGRVKIVRVVAEASSIQAGDILVTEMTNPDYVPYMKIAGAIVTDEGGATCHAAIASRELKVPCIVGTKIATKVIKDGDIVEVDADNGIVKIVKQ